ncbi:auxin-repressed 12.5 kDa protein [Hordeum vulgare]|nr:auxin-repressed 12.5 kDa protein [Hordeum vulgare]
MGLVDQLWDDTVRRPDHGLGKLQRYSSFSPSSSSGAAAADAAAVTIARPPSLSLPSGESSSVPSSPASAPDSPLAAGKDILSHLTDTWLNVSQVRRSHTLDASFELYVEANSMMDGWRAFRRKTKMASVDVGRAEATVGPRRPTVYDWCV